MRIDCMEGNENTMINILVWPLKALWDLTAFILQANGRLLAVVLGGVFMLVGALISLTVVGAVIGIPMALFGFALVLRGLF
jgi:hypothetical protein